MTDKERLEEIRAEVEQMAYTSPLNFEKTRINKESALWLIQQTERVEELELEVNDWRAEVQKWQKFYKESEESHLETKELLKSIVNQNKRQAEKMEYWRKQHRKRCNELEDAYFRIQLIENQLHQAQAKAERYREALEFYADWFRN